MPHSISPALCMQCDDCGTLLQDSQGSPVVADAKGLETAAVSQGWLIETREEFAPECSGDLVEVDASVCPKCQKKEVMPHARLGGRNSG